MKYYQIFGRNNCPWCVKASEVLESHNLDFMMCDMEKSPSLLQHYKDLYNMRTVPIVVEVDLFEDTAKIVGGCSDLINYLGDTGADCEQG
jgi:glutaredoxin